MAMQLEDDDGGLLEEKGMCCTKHMGRGQALLQKKQLAFTILHTTRK